MRRELQLPLCPGRDLRGSGQTVHTPGGELSLSRPGQRPPLLGPQARKSPLPSLGAHLWEAPHVADLTHAVSYALRPLRPIGLRLSLST